MRIYAYFTALFTQVVAPELRNKLLAQALLAISQVIFPLITYPVVTRALHPAGLGEVNFADAIAQFLVMACSLGIPLYGIREISIRRYDPPARSRTFHELFFLQLTIAVPAAFLMLVTGWMSGMAEDLVLLAGANVLASALTSEWFLQGTESFLYVALRSLLIRGIAAVLIFIFIRVPGDAPLYYGILVSSVVITVLLNLALIFRIARFPHPFPDLGIHLAKVNWIYGCYLLISVYTLLDTAILGWLSNDVAVGYYSLGYRLVRMSAMFIISLGVVFIPRIAYHYAAGEEEAQHDQVSISQQLIFFFALPMSIAFYLLAPEIVAVLASERFYPSVQVIRILSIIPLLISFSHLTGMQIMLSLRKERTFFKFLLAGTLLSIGLNFILIPQVAHTGAAIANVVAEIFITITTGAWLVRRKLLAIHWRSLFQNMVSSMILIPVVFMLRYFNLPSLPLLLLSVLISGFLHIIVHVKWVRTSALRNLFVKLPA